MLRRVAQASSSNKSYLQTLSRQLMNGVDAMLQPPRAAGFASDAGTKDGAATDAAAAPDASHPDEEADASGQEGSVVELQAQLADSQARVSELETELENVKGRAVTVMADMENLRKRTAQQMEETRQFALQGFCKNILDVPDNLERALDSVPGTVLEAAKNGGAAPAADDGVTPEIIAKNLSSLHGGVAMSQKVMLKIFQENGLEKVETEVGGEFDPNIHNAMFEVPTADIEAGRVAAVIKAGYTLNGRVIRAAGVGIAKPLED